MFSYLHDLIFVSKDLESHLHKLDLVFTKLEKAGLKAKLSKCDFLKSRIEFLGHVVDGAGIHTVDSKINSVKHFPTLQNVENVGSFLGLAGYYRALVRNYASTASLLTRLLRKDVPFIWHDAQRQAFESLKHFLTHAAVLAFLDYKQLFTMRKDASTLGVGAVLMEAFESQPRHVIAYARRVLNSAESKYSVTHLDVLDVVWALIHVLNILYGYPITVYTDHSAVTQLFSGKNLTGRLARWYPTVMQFEPTINIYQAKPMPLLIPCTQQQSKYTYVNTRIHRLVVTCRPAIPKSWISSIARASRFSADPGGYCLPLSQAYGVCGVQRSQPYPQIGSIMT